jgi:hypothetical protein
MNKLLTLITVTGITAITCFGIDPPKFKYGLGGGINFSNIIEKKSYPLYEDISGEEYNSKYSLMFVNIGSQFFFHGEFVFDQIILAIKPGTYTYKFSKTDEVVFNNEVFEQNSNYLLRYMNFPLEVKWMIGDGNVKPFIGIEGAYGYLMRQGGDANNSFIKSRFSAGPVGGAYFSFENFELVFASGYNMGLHIINSKDNRYNTSTDNPFSQSDIILNNLHASLSVLFSFEKSNLKKSLECVKFKKKR